MRINHNIQALNAYRNLYKNQFNTSKNLERLSSGLRINRAADDAAGLAISEKMRSQIRGLKQAERNSLDGVSLMQTAEGAMTEVHEMLQRMRELAVQAANDTNTTEDREAIQKEIDQLLLEIDSIAKKTEFNTRRLLDGSSAADTQFRENQVQNTNIKSLPVVTDPSMKTGLYKIGVESPPQLVNTLNQPGAGVSSEDVIRIGTTKILENQNGANIENINAANVEAGEYQIDFSNIKTSGVLGSGSNIVVNSGITVNSKFAPGNYTIQFTDYNSGTSEAAFAIYDESGNVVWSEKNIIISSSGKVSLGDNGEVTLSGVNISAASGSIKISVTTTADITIKNSKTNNVAAKATGVKFTNGGIQELQLNVSGSSGSYNASVSGDYFYLYLDPTKITSGNPTTFKVLENQLALGQYEIQVTNYQLDSQGRPSATIEVFNPDGFSIGKQAFLIGEKHGTIVTIGDGDKTVQIDTRKISKTGTAKVQIEAEVNISVALATQSGSDGSPLFTPITFSRKLTTANGKVTHGGLELEFGANVKQGETQFDITNKALSFQIGANTNQNVMIDVPELSTVKLGIEDISVLSYDDANEAIFKLDKAINQISAVRAKLGATQNRLEHTINNLQVTYENLSSAESRIRDADMALEMTEFTKNNILNQSAQAMLAQANQLPQGILQLLQG